MRDLIMVRLNIGLIIAWLAILTFPFKNIAKDSKIESPENEYVPLILAGGALKTCSSFSQKNCTDADFSQHALTEIQFQFSSNRWHQLENTEFFQSLPGTQKQHIYALFQAIYTNHKEDSISKSEIKATLKKLELLTTLNNLPDPAYYAFFDYFEFSQTHNGSRKKEVVKLENNNNVHSKHIIEVFAQSSKQNALRKHKTKPTLIAITASSRDPFESADFYQGLLESFDAEVYWLPITPSLQHAIENKRCADLELIRNKHNLFNRNRIYPSRTMWQHEICQNPTIAIDIIKKADGIFFNGGDQSKTISALTNSDGTDSLFLTAIKQSIAGKSITIAGTSAGTAVQAGGKYSGKSIAMISNGDPELALKYGAISSAPPSERAAQTAITETLPAGQLTYRPQGGTGLFQYGLLDTHFSERDREIRLAVLAQTLSIPLAFGVDETTALVMKEAGKNKTLQVIGENGVFIYQSPEIQGNNELSGESRYVSGIAHFLNAGDKMVMSESGEISLISFNSNSQPLNKFSRASEPKNKYGVWRKEIAYYCGTKKQISWQWQDIQYLAQPTAQTRFAKSTRNQCSYIGLPFVISQNIKQEQS
jgi:cyanophycinase